jgi:hypothetical protein
MSEAEPPLPDPPPGAPSEEAPPGRDPAAQDPVETYDRCQRAEKQPPPAQIQLFLNQLLPPLLLAPLISTPVDFPVFLFWLIGAICLLISIVSAVIRLLGIGFGAASKRRERLLHLIRPMLTIVIVSTAHICVQHSMYLAEHQAAVVGDSVQREARRTGSYPETLANWQLRGWDDEKHSTKELGWTAEYRATYRRYPAGDGFTITLHVDMDTSMVVSGSVKEELSAKIGHYAVEPRKLSMQELLSR